ncbi:MAG: hypothetical protein KVP17_004757 [Porospora cf. gigantea B]|uniref:uncharacterized protein n=1 Tax=Porospora cf. gigantea B TaxID=2853592 RepID=UPI003571FAB0|nr:MAG: hypothetical protein KVP17_004757 [Porospora cf. gigantea B]
MTISPTRLPVGASKLYTVCGFHRHLTQEGYKEMERQKAVSGFGLKFQQEAVNAAPLTHFLVMLSVMEIITRRIRDSLFWMCGTLRRKTFTIMIRLEMNPLLPT